MKIDVKLKMVMMPNFLTMEMPARPRQEGFTELPKVSVGELSEEQASQYADEMRAAFMSHWRDKRKNIQPGLTQQPQ
jgi:hypothetical protein